MAKSKYSSCMVQLGGIWPQKGMTYSFLPKYRPENIQYHHIEGLVI